VCSPRSIRFTRETRYRNRCAVSSWFQPWTEDGSVGEVMSRCVESSGVYRRGTEGGENGTRCRDGGMPDASLHDAGVSERGAPQSTDVISRFLGFKRSTYLSIFILRISLSSPTCPPSAQRHARAKSTTNAGRRSTRSGRRRRNPSLILPNRRLHAKSRAEWPKESRS
jgi:hypothetical protein